MRKISFHLGLIAILAIQLGCGGKPGGLKAFEEIVPEFIERLNKACDTGIYDDLLRLFDKKAKLIISPEFHPEVLTTPEKIREYFTAFPLEIKFSISEVTINNLLAETHYSYTKPNGAIGTGIWQFKLTNMGKIAELSIIPNE